jgi:uncharacterized membrane protein YcaP (DUF421 family)
LNTILRGITSFKDESFFLINNNYLRSKIMEQFTEVVWKSVLSFIMLIVLTRFIGRKLLSQMSFFDYVIGITLGTITGSYVVEATEGMWVLISPFILALCIILFDYINLKSLWFRKLSEGEPVVVIQNGKILEKSLFKLRYNINDLEMQLRDKGAFNFGEIEFAILEPHGQLSVLKKTQNQPITPQDLKMSTHYKGISTEIIKDGDIIEQNLKQNNLTFSWLYNELKGQNIEKLKDVTYAALNTDGTLFIDMKDDEIEYLQKVED